MSKDIRDPVDRTYPTPILKTELNINFGTFKKNKFNNKMKKKT